MSHSAELINYSPSLKPLIHKSLTFTFTFTFTFFLDLNVVVPLTDDIVKLEYVIGHTFYTEYFVYPLKEPVSKERQQLQEKAQNDPNKLNVLFLMIDSISRASAQRYLNATYQMMAEDPNSVIMKVKYA